eukprot:1418211-Lingulodinium_polyedra.AAC.1
MGQCHVRAIVRSEEPSSANPGDKRRAVASQFPVPARLCQICVFHGVACAKLAMETCAVRSL